MLLIAGGAWLWRKWFLKRHERRMGVESIRREMEKTQWMNEMRMKMAKEHSSESQPEEMKHEDVVLHMKAEDLVFFTRNVCEQFQSPNPEKKAKVNFLSSVDQLDVDIDEEKMKEAFEILFRNSVMFTPEEPVISVGVARTQDGKAQIQIADNGIGIKDEYKEHAFDPMVNGEGIGLDRVKDIIDGHGGSIRLEDNPGGGTIFYITLPIIDDAVEVEVAEIIED